MTIIHFAHANGFPAGTYEKMFACLGRSADVRYIERHGHDPRFPVTDGWSELRDELIEAVADHGEPVVGVGHSLGGVLHFLAAIKNPELYSQIILLDAPIISRLSSHGLRVLKVSGLIDRFSPSRITRSRRNRWDTAEDAYRHFLAKPKFAAFDRDVLRDYVGNGLSATERGFELFFSPRVEAKIYRTIPHHLPGFRGKLSVPTSYIGGSNSREGRLARLSFMKKHFPVDYYELEGTHLFPMEVPESTASLIISIIKQN